MCKQDIRIGRALSYRSQSQAVAAGATSTELLKANPERISLVASLITEGADAATIVEVFTGTGTDRVTLGSLNRAQPSFMVDVDRLGPGLFGPVFASANGTGAAGFTVRVSETFLIAPLDNVE